MENTATNQTANSLLARNVYLHRENNTLRDRVKSLLQMLGETLDDSLTDSQSTQADDLFPTDEATNTSQQSVSPTNLEYESTDTSSSQSDPQTNLASTPNNSPFTDTDAS